MPCAAAKMKSWTGSVLDKENYRTNFERWLIIGAGASVEKTAQLAVTKVTSVFRSMGKMSENVVGNSMMVMLVH